MTRGVRSAIARAHSAVRSTAASAKLEAVAQLPGSLDAKRVRELGPAAKLILLREDGRETSFEVVRTIEANWSGRKNSPNQRAATFHVFDNSAEFARDARKATHFVVTGSILPVLNYAVHEKDEELTAPPDGANPWWRIGGVGIDKRFEPPAVP
jgi:hypothetical protein